MARIVTCIILFSCSLFLNGCNLQRNMLYYPDTNLPTQAVLSAYGIQYWPSDTREYRGFISLTQASRERGTIIVFHGNAGTAADRVFYVRTLTRFGYRVILAEYPGYGGRTGEPGEETFVRDAQETLRLASEKFGGPIYVLGESLGCGVAAAAIRNSFVKIDGIMLITPWETLLSVAKEKVTWLPVGLFMQDTYDSISNLKGYRGRIIVVGAEQDTVIPMRHAEALFQALSEAEGPRKMYTIKGAGHNDWPRMVDATWWKEITDYLQGNGSYALQ